MSKTILDYGGLVSRASFYLMFLDNVYGFEKDFKRFRTKNLSAPSREELVF